IEAKDSNGNMLEPAGLLALVKEVLDPAKPESTIPTLVQSINDRTGGGLRADDVTILLLRPNGTGAKVSLWNSLAAPFRVIASIAPPAPGKAPMPPPTSTPATPGAAFSPPLSPLWRRRIV